MKTEIEAKFLNVDPDKVRESLRAIGAILFTPMRLMRRVTIDNGLMKSKDAYLRVRDEGDKTTLTYKQFDSLSVDGAKEIEIVVSDFADMVRILENAGLKPGSFQESKREAWQIDQTEVLIDIWPWLNPYIEIEGENESSVRDVAEKLGYKWEDAIFGDVMAAYRIQYPHLTDQDTIGNLPEVRFDMHLPDMLKP